MGLNQLSATSLINQTAKYAIRVHSQLCVQNTGQQLGRVAEGSKSVLTFGRSDLRS